MSKTCKICGTINSDTATVCTRCRKALTGGGNYGGGNYGGRNTGGGNYGGGNYGGGRGWKAALDRYDALIRGVGIAGFALMLLSYLMPFFGGASSRFPMAWNSMSLVTLLSEGIKIGGELTGVAVAIIFGLLATVLAIVSICIRNYIITAICGGCSLAPIVAVMVFLGEYAYEGVSVGYSVGFYIMLISFVIGIVPAVVHFIKKIN